jgi:hypothetical protein
MGEQLDRTSMTQRVVEDLVYEHARVSGETFQIDAETWAIHGFIAVDGDVIMATFDSRDDAVAAIAHLWAAEQRSLRR